MKDGIILGRGWTQDGGRPHAEVDALRRAKKSAQGATMYVTLEPCAMCSGAMLHARLRRVVFGCADPKTGAAGSVFNLLGDSRHNHCVEVQGGLLAGEAGSRLTSYFRRKRGKPAGE